MEIKRVYDFPEIGEKDMYLLYHEELESLALNIKGLRQIRFFMTFGQSYLTHLKCLENVGMTSIQPVEYEGKQIVPLQFLKAVLPDPAALGPRTIGKTNIGCIFRGVKDGKEKTYYIYNVCDHQECYREVGSQASFYQPWVVDGVRIWLDASAAAFSHRGGFMEEKDWRGGLICCPQRLTRWAVQEEGLPICPEPLHDWFPNPKRPLDIRDCFTGEDCWMGPYNGGATHCGLDINMPIGTPLRAPFAADTQRSYDSVASGANNNRWIGERLWPDGSLWQIQTSHVVEVFPPPHTPLRAGEVYASAAGIAYGITPHTHFIWRVWDQGATYYLDPWILFAETS
jgi:hypothetical protein